MTITRSIANLTRYENLLQAQVQYTQPTSVVDQTFANGGFSGGWYRNQPWLVDEHINPTGTEGLLFDLELRERLPAGFSVTQFLDWGAIRVNKDNDFNGAAQPNSEQLKGGGISVGWVASFGLSLKATVSHRIGSNPDPTTTGTDQDGSLITNRVWVQATMPF